MSIAKDLQEILAEYRTHLATHENLLGYSVGPILRQRIESLETLLKQENERMLAESEGIVDVQRLRLADLFMDRADSLADIAVCERAIRLGITYHQDGYPVAERLKVNREIIGKIDDELARRGELPRGDAI